MRSGNENEKGECVIEIQEDFEKTNEVETEIISAK